MPRQDVFGDFANSGRMQRLVDQAGQPLRLASIGSRLLAARQRARGFNWIEGGVMAAPPGVTIGAIGMALPAGMTAMVDGRFGTNRAAYRVRGTGGPAFEENVGGNSNYFMGRSERINTVGGFAYGESSWTITIPTDSRYLAFELLGSAARAYSVYVRDLVGTNSGLTAAAGHNIGAANQTLLLDFGAAGDREVTLLLPNGIGGVRGIAWEQSASLFSTPPDDLKILVKGDSYVWGSISPQPAFAGRTLVDSMRALLDCDIVSQGIGGSGYITGNNLQNLYRQEDAAAVGADLNIIPLGVNDVTNQVGAPLQAAAERSLQGLRDRGMEGNTIVVGPWPMNRMTIGASAGKNNLLQAEADIAAAVAKLNDPGMVFLPLSTAGMATPWGGTCTPWVTGSQDTGSAAGDAGNSRRVTGDDKAHPSQYGAVFLGRRLVNEVTRTCLALGW